MKRFVLPVLLALICLFLMGCGSAGARQSYDELSHRIRVGQQLSFTAAVRAEYSDRSYDFTLDYRRGADSATVTVVQPKLIAGISARVENGDTALEYEGIRLDVGELDDYGLTPMSALPVLVDALQNGHFDSWWEEDGKTVLLLTEDDHLSATVWLESSGMTPMRAELVSDGTVVVFCDIYDWSCVGG